MNNWQREHMHDYFEYNGGKYYFGTRCTRKDRDGNIVKAVFIGWLPTPKGHILYSFYYPSGCYINKYGYTKYSHQSFKCDELNDMIVEILDGNYYEELEKSKKYIPDSQVPEIVLGWIMYIAIMLGLVIFTQRWLGWIAATIYFFNWRRKKKEENSYYTKTDF